MPDLVGDLGDINKVKAMFHELLDEATLVPVVLPPAPGQVQVIGLQLRLKPLPPAAK